MLLNGIYTDTRLFLLLLLLLSVFHSPDYFLEYISEFVKIYVDIHDLVRGIQNMQLSKILFLIDLIN